MFGIVGTTVVVDIIFLILTTVESNSKLRREYEEIEANNVTTYILAINQYTSIHKPMCYMIGQ